ncbi:MAG: adenosylcobinamide-GDP ribazoletransferase [Candidatus Nitricoxidivorans perseverans]|uniref:Adenosylcobinamide-GDP ribazoletransferase n=1 Tax=Candidatus Nitricoxidivorans perseverans TaxID=2975601 RepID=A0AA49FK57_9PROT|nr:MAG: adenosylcobinamide-GDP ribazoletransferase [Candidatus Nitricoxidivorans perseverans]
MMREIERFLAALSFFTRLPVPGGHSGAGLDGAARYLPLVGIVVGGIGAAVTWASAWALPLSLAVIAGMAATILATGAFHEDGFSDACDGFGGGWEKAQVLAIMKDPRVGSYGAIGVALMLLAKWNALMEIANEALPLALIAAHAMSRFAATTLMFSLDYVREEGKSKPVAKRMGAGDLAVAGAFGLAPCLLLPYTETLVALAATALATFLCARTFVRRIGGVTGDCLGATQQVAELAFYIGFLVQWNSG